MVAVFLGSVVGGCTDEPGSTGPSSTSRVEQFSYPILGRDQMDLLFVVDRSPAMAPYRTRVLDMFPLVATQLAARPGGAPNLNVAVTTGELADGGALRTSPRLSGSFVIDGWREGARTTNYTGDLGSLLAELADVGSSGGDTTEPMDVMPLALAASGFLRPQALLAIFVIAASDDASTVAVDTLVPALKALTNDPGRVFMLGVYPPSAPRLDALLAEFPNRSAYASIEANDLSGGIVQLLQITNTVVGSPCLEWTPLDLSPESPGGQYDCYVEETRDGGAATSIARCSGLDASPCWDIVVDPQSCPQPGNLAFRLEHGAAGRPWESGVISGQCVVE